ncbi:MAG: aldo/keto reductase [Firmicutes bacterium]|nr:aldo/keto reductase [Bacillota bacterium]
MQKRQLGKSDIYVSPLGFGTLTIGPFQRNLPVDAGAEIIVHAVNNGINLLDTAHLYETYPYIGRALEILGPEKASGLAIVSRSYDYSEEGMEESFNKALNEMGIETISIFMLHETESEATIRGHKPALDYLVKRKHEGRLKLVGISTHYIAAVRAASEMPEIDVIFAILNREGIGIMDGTPEEMETALTEAHKRGKGIMLMKAVGGGHLYRNARSSLAWARDLPFADCVVVGMQNKEEVDFNCSVFRNDYDDLPETVLTEKHKKSLWIEDYCQGCGACRDACPFKAITITDGIAKVNPETCMLCSYCARHCPLFCIKVV